MKTELDSAAFWLLEMLKFSEDSRSLCATVIEEIESEEATDLVIGDAILRDTHALEVTPASRRYTVRFQCIAAWQSIAEVLTVLDKDESRDDMGVLRALTKSKYLDFIQANHGWFESLGHGEEYVHYQLITEWQIVDVVAAAAPVIERV